MLYRHLKNAQIELKTGEQYRGVLKNTQDNWNCQFPQNLGSWNFKSFQTSRILGGLWANLMRPVSEQPTHPSLALTETDESNFCFKITVRSSMKAV